MMRTYSFHTVDVFTDKPFGGNPVAVFPDAEGLSDAEMQAIAREMNLSETTFVLPADDPQANVRVRFFTPRTEIPFAGHPTLGTHFVLAQLGRYPLQDGTVRVWQQIGVGTLPVDLWVRDGRVTRVVMTQAKPQFLTVVEEVDELAAALGIDPEEIRATNLPAQVVSTGLMQMMVPVRSLKAVQNISLNVGPFNAICARAGSTGAMVFTFQTLRHESAAHTRYFDPTLDVMEDPATGSASGALGAYLVHHRALTIQARATLMTLEQGYELERPSRIFVEVEREGDEVAQVRVGGEVVRVIEGKLEIP